jgi:hypothetical protein
MKRIGAYPKDGKVYSVYTCIRSDCGIEAWTDGDDSMHLMSEWAYILETEEQREAREVQERLGKAESLSHRLRHRSIWIASAPYPAKIIAIGLSEGVALRDLESSMPTHVFSKNLHTAKAILNGAE